MESILGLLRIRVLRGINLVVRDLVSSDPYVIITMGNQSLKTRVVKKNCNPEWNEELTLSITDTNISIKLEVFDRDTFTGDDKMGDAEIDIKPYIESLKMGLKNLPDGCVVSRVQPQRDNCIARESCVVWNDGKIKQDMFLRLQHVESGEIEIQLEWIDVPGCKGLQSEEKDIVTWPKDLQCLCREWEQLAGLVRGVRIGYKAVCEVCSVGGTNVYALFLALGAVLREGEIPGESTDLQSLFVYPLCCFFI